MNSSTRLSAETTGASSITNRKQTLEALRTKVEDKIANLGSGQFNLTDCVKLHEDIEELKNSDTLSPDQLAEISFKVFPYFLKLRHYAGIEYFLSSVPYLEHHNIMITNPKLLSIEWLLQWCQHGKKPLSNEKTTSQLKERLLPILFQSEKNDALAMLYFLEVSQENRIEAECFFYEASQAITRLCSDVANTDHTIVLQRLYNKRYLLPPVLNKHLVKSLDKAEETKDNQKNRIKSASLYSSIRRNAFSSSIPHSQHLAYEMNAFDLKEHFENKISGRSLRKTITQIIAAITPTIAGAAILAPLSMIDLGLTIILGILITILTINLGVLALMLVDHAFGPEPILERPKLPSQDVDFSIDIFSKPGASPFPSAPPIATAIALNELEEQAYQATAVQNKSFYR